MSEAPDSGTETFLARRCGDCGALYGHPPVVCRECGCEAFETADLGGSGRLYASTVVRVPGSDHRGQEPFRVGLVDVGDGETVRVTARVAGDPDGRLDPGATVAFVGTRDGAFHFRPV